MSIALRLLYPLQLARGVTLLDGQPRHKELRSGGFVLICTGAILQAPLTTN